MRPLACLLVVLAATDVLADHGRPLEQGTFRFRPGDDQKAVVICPNGDEDTLWSKKKDDREEHLCK